MSGGNSLGGSLSAAVCCICRNSGLVPTAKDQGREGNLA